MPTMQFDKGDKVEVIRNYGKSSFLPAIVLRPSPGKHKGKMYVKYETLTASERNTKRLKEYVSAGSVRPSLPVELHRYFKEGEKVDVFYENAWREGKLVDIHENSRYSVMVGEIEEKVEFDQWNLRLHRDWDDGSWIPPLDNQMKSPEADGKPRKLKLRIKFGGRASEANFSKGTPVEVRSDKEDYHGFWFNAVIVDSIGNGKFLVEYKTQRADKIPKLFRENVDVCYVRPCPPEIPHLYRYVQFEEVDAFFNGGWRVGNISDLLDGNKYVVSFGSMNEELIVEHSKLRTHQEWIDGKWVASSRVFPELVLTSRESDTKFKVKANERKLAAKFSKRTVVEIKSDEPGYHGSWYTAVIVDPIEEDTYLIEYQTLKTEDESEPLKEKADATYIRPCPPDIQRVDRFRLFERVDAWYNDGWWVGLVSRVLDGLNYAVYFWTTNEELKFGHFTLRPHQEWINGEFIADFMKNPSPLPRKPRPGKLKRQNGLLPSEANYFFLRMKVEVRSDEEGYSGTWYPAIIVSSEGSGKYLVEYKTLGTDDKMELLKEEVDAFYMRPCPPIIQRAYPFEHFDDVDAWYSNAWWNGCVRKVLQGSMYTVHIKSINEMLEFQHSDLRRHTEWTGGKWIIPSRETKIR